MTLLRAWKWWGWKHFLIFWAFPPFLRWIGWLPIGLGPARWRLRKYLFKQQNGLCYYCGGEMSLTARRKDGSPAQIFATFEHLIRREDGGTNSAENLVLAHGRCNWKKNREDQRRQSEERRKLMDEQEYVS